MQRTLRVRHEPSSLPALSEALASLQLDAKLLDMESGQSETVPSVWRWRVKLTLAGVFALASEGVEFAAASNLSFLG